MTKDLQEYLSVSLERDNLAILCGAGLSMGPPTALPSAADLTKECVAEYEAITGATLTPDERADLEAFADYLIDRDHLVFPFIEQVVPWARRFQHCPNPGHIALADLILSRAIVAAVSTNYDTHIEDAAFQLGEGDPRAALDGVEANLHPRRYRPLLKIHGCFRIARADTIWHPRQLTQPPIRERVARNAAWLAGQLQGRDLLLVGFWSDWAYLQAVLDACIANVTPQAVVVVNPGTAAELEAKAPLLWSWASGCGAEFFHEPVRAEVFLPELRHLALAQFVRKLLHVSRTRFEALLGHPFAGDLPDPLSLSPEKLGAMRRDLVADSARGPSRTIRPDGLEYAGALILRMLELGGELLGDSIVFRGECIRLLRRPDGSRLSQVKADLDAIGDVTASVDRVVCIGVVDDHLPTHIVRGARPPGVVRSGSSAHWLSAREFEAELGMAV